ncbi:MAG: universal stress protein [Ardenticatenaceae bacterium]|nr:universal stress protein [Ardenticatenaceae bacterium]
MFQFKKILIPLDGSELAERALQPALSIAQATSATLVLLRVIPPLFLSVDPIVYDQISQQSEDEALAYLRDLQSRQIPPETAVHLVTISGPVAGTILQYAQEHACDLIIMSSHGRSGVSRWVYGSVAEKVLHGACCHVFIIRAQIESELFTHKRILVPLDGSELAEKALPPAVSLAHALGVEIVILGVIPPAHLTIETTTMKQQADYLESHESEDAQAYMQTIRASLSGQNLINQVETIKGPVAETIIDYANTHRIDLIVMSSHGRSGIGRWIFGSVTEKVLRGASVATFVIRGNSGKP